MSAKPKNLADAVARARISAELDHTFLVEAAAGTGKTTSLVSRMVALVREGKCSVDQVAAITFTVKAAAELRERFQEALEHELRMASDAGQRARLQVALRDFATCFAGTIHAFCARLLRERPVEAGLDPGFEEVTEEEAAGLPRDFWERYVQRLYASSDPRLLALHDTAVKPNELHSFFGRLCEYTDVEPVSAENATPPDLGPALGATLQFLAQAESEFRQDTCTDEDALKVKLKQMIGKRRFLRPGSPGSVIPFLELTESESGRKQVFKRWSLDKWRVEKIRDDFNALVASSIAPTLRRWREYTHALILSLMKPAVAQFAEERRAAGKLTFQDLLLNARTLLREHPNVRRYYQRRFPYLLVDEFQDTDPIQAEIIFYLTGVEVEQTDWRKLTPKPGALFIVGDPKQSIYRFRRADIVTYLQVQKQVEKSGGEVLRLNTNFRSVPEICTHVNDFFRTVFTGDAVKQHRQAPHVDAMAHRQSAGQAGVYLLETQAATNDVVAQNEASCIARWIRDAVDQQMPMADDGGVVRGATWSDFLLLSRNTTRLQTYAEALDAVGVPFEVTGGKAFAKSEEIALLLPFLRTVMDGDDAVSLVAYLRGPLCGVDDQALFDYKQSGGRFRVYAASPVVPPAASRRASPSVAVPINDGKADAQFSASARRQDAGGPAGRDAGATKGRQRSDVMRASAQATLFPAQSPLTAGESARSAEEGHQAETIIDRRIAEALRLLREANEWSRALPPAAAIGRMLERLGLTALAGSLPRGEVRSGNLQKVLTLARRLSADGASFGDVVEELARMVEAEKCEIEEMSIEPSKGDAVRLMNVHQAKGLEAGVVFLIDPNDLPDWPMAMHIDREGDVARGYFPIHPSKKEPKTKSWVVPKPLGMPPDWGAREPIEKDFTAREEERLLYVAATRAKNLLVIGVEAKSGGPSGPWKRLAAGLRRLFPHGEAKPKPAAPATVLEDFAEGRRYLQERRESAHQESYAVTLVTKVAHSDGKKLVKHEEGYGRGTSWGRVLHRLFDAMLRDPKIDIRRHATNLLKDEEREVAELEDVLRVVEGVRQSEIWRRAIQSDQQLMEVPFALNLPAAALGEPGSGNILLHGAIDLVFREKGEWYVVDYKSDSTKGRLEALIEYYRPQVEHYARYWQQLTGQPTHPGLFFVDTAHMEWLDGPSSPSVASAP